MKKIFAVALLCTILLGCFTGCAVDRGGTKDNDALITFVWKTEGGEVTFGFQLNGEEKSRGIYIIYGQDDYTSGSAS